MKFSILMNTYNRANRLRWVLRSYLRQTEGDFEIVVADDGSTDDTAQVVDEFRTEAPFEVSHVVQEDCGHRRAAILNRAIEKCRFEQILFTDSDSLALANLIAVHRKFARPDRLLCGGYLRLTEEQTESIDDRSIDDGSFETMIGRVGRYRLFRKHFRAQWQIIRRRARRPHNMGLNYSVRREALVKINGYDEEFEGWGSADGDVRERLRATGVRPYSLYDKAIVLHMWHPIESTKLDRENLRRNRAYANRKDISVVCKRGLRPLEETGVTPEDSTVG